jgi:hypothetical protein
MHKTVSATFGNLLISLAEHVKHAAGPAPVSQNVSLSANFS